MTLINVISSTIYARKLTLKDKIQMYGIAVIFLVLLYNSPSGLVFYWTLNNLFSLCKNLFYSIKPIHNKKTTKTKSKKEIDIGKSSAMLFFLGCLFMALLTGRLIPSSIIRSSPAEFVVASDFRSPLLYVFNAFLLATGTFIIWIGLFYYLAKEKVRQIMCVLIWIISVFSIVDYMFFGTNLGNLSSELKYDVAVDFSLKEIMINSEIVILSFALLLVVWVKKRKIVQTMLPLFIISVVGMSIYNIVGMASVIPKIKNVLEQDYDKKASFSLSRNGKNVIVFMLDRGISSYVPYFFQEKPELKKQFEGFTWYPNTLSYGTHTNTGAPSLFGGYEYTPEELNMRDTEHLEDKHNEALKVMPVLFDQAGFEVTVCDPPYAGYSWIPDLSIYDDYPNIRRYNTENGQFLFQENMLEKKQQIWNRNLYCFSIMKVSPLIFQWFLYDEGLYYNPSMRDYSINLTNYINRGEIVVGVADSFTESYAVLCALPEITNISNDNKNTFLMMQNSAAHNVRLLQEPQYEPELNLDNESYDVSHGERFVYNGRVMNVDSDYKMSHYQCNMASFIKFGEWFDYMRKEGVYDNTRIIIVSDHGFPLKQFQNMIFGEDNSRGNTEDAMAYNPILLVKDFDSKEFKVDNRFLTNADTALLATDKVIENPINPFTNNFLSDDAKYSGEQHVFDTSYCVPEENNGTTFLPGKWYSLKNNNIFDVNNWSNLRDD